MTLSSRSKSDPNVGELRDATKIGKTLIQMGDKYRESGDIKRATNSYNLAKAYLPQEAQRKRKLIPQWILSSENDSSIHHPFGEGYHRTIVKEKASKVSNFFKRSSHKPSVMGPFFPKQIQPVLSSLISQEIPIPQTIVHAFNEAPDTNSVVTCYTGANEMTKPVLRNHINEIISQFNISFICMETVQELVILAMIPDREIFLHIITQMLKVLKEKPLLASTVLQGIAVAINSCPDEVDMSDMQGVYLDILRPLKKHLETVRSDHNEYQLIPLLYALSALLNAMVCQNVSALDREAIFNPLTDLLDGFKSHDDTTVVFLASYAKQALAYIGNNESLAMSIFRRARLAIVMAGDIASGVSSADPSKFESAYNSFTAMCDFSVQSEWYPGLAYVDCILELQNWSAFEEFVLQSKLKSDVCFLQGICLRLEQITVTQQNEIKDGAIAFLQALAAGPAKMVQKAAQAALNRLGDMGSFGCDSNEGTQHMLKTPSDRLIPQNHRHSLPPVWDPTWHTAIRSTLLQAVQRKERTNENLDKLSSHLDGINQSIKSTTDEVKCAVKSRHAQTSAELDIANTNISKIMESMGIPPSLDDVHMALKSYYEPSLFIRRVSGDEMDLESCYINLAVIEAPGQREKDKQDLKAQSAKFRCMPSHERTEGTNLELSIPLEELFSKRKLRNGNNDVPKTILIHGRAGIGKTTLCKKLVHLSLSGQWRDNFDGVLWLPLRELRSSFKSRNFMDLLSEKYFSGYSDLKRMGLARTLFTQAENGKVLFILDGLDELQTDDDRALKDFLSQLLRQQHVVITSRPSGVDKSILPTIDLELETIGFSPQNVKDYLQNVAPDMAKEVQDFIYRTPIIQGLVNIPVQLDAICYSWGSLPSNINEITITELYQVMVCKLWRKDAVRLGKTSSGRIISENIIQSLPQHKVSKLMDIEVEYLGYLAFKGLKNGQQIIFDEKALTKAIQDLDENRQKNNMSDLPCLLLHDLKQTSFLHSADADLNTKVRNFQGSWFFLHLTFQEYFAAAWIARHLQTKPVQNVGSPVLMMAPEETRKFVLEYKYDPRFEIVWWMVAGQLEGDSLILFFDLLQGAPMDLIGGYHHQLLAACLKECRSQLDSKRIESVEMQLVLWLNLEMTTNDNGFYGDESSTLGSMSYFSEELLIKKLLIDALHDNHVAVRKSAAKALGNQLTLPEPALLALISTLQDMYTDVRDQAADALGKQLEMPESALLALVGEMHCKDERTSRLAASALGEQLMLSDSASKALIGALQNEFKDIRNLSAFVLGKQLTLSEPALQALIGALKDESKDVRESATDALGKQLELPESALLALIGALQDESEDVRESAAKALGKQTTLPESVLLVLIDTLQDKGENVRKSVVSALGEQLILPESALQALIGALQDECKDVQESAADALGKQSSLPESALLALISILQDGNEDVKESAASALGKQSTLPESALLALISTLQDGSEDIKESAASALGEQPTLPESALLALIDALQDENEMVRKSTAFVLGKQASLSESTLLALIDALQDKSEDVRKSAISALGQQSTLLESALLAFISALQDESKDIRESAASALGKQSILPESALLALIGALQDENSYVRRSAAKALGNQLALPESALLALIDALQDMYTDVRDQAADALGKQQKMPESVLLTLINALKNKNASVRKSAVRALGLQLTLPESALLALIGALQDQNDHVSYTAASVLVSQSKLSGSALLALIDALQDKSKHLKISVEALEQHAELIFMAIPSLPPSGIEMLHRNFLIPYGSQYSASFLSQVPRAMSPKTPQQQPKTPQQQPQQRPETPQQQPKTPQLQPETPQQPQTPRQPKTPRQLKAPRQPETPNAPAPSHHSRILVNPLTPHCLPGTPKRHLGTSKNATLTPRLGYENTSSRLRVPMSDNVLDISTLQAQLAALSARFDAMAASSPSPKHNSYLVPREQAVDITPDDAILALYPAMDGKDFFLHKSGDTSADLEYATDMAKEMQSFPKNTTQSYTAPKPSGVAWPDSATHQAATDKLISRYQARLANLTRPLDAFATEMFTGQVAPEIAQACLEFAQTMREHIAHLAQTMSSDREDLVFQAHKISVSKETSESPIVSTSAFIEAAKLAKSIRQATSQVRGRGRRNRGHGSFFPNSNYSY
ncbi:hypothetical protein BGX27_004723, partial [Mortierella sp. AM989]